MRSMTDSGKDCMLAAYSLRVGPIRTPQLQTLPLTQEDGPFPPIRENRGIKPVESGPITRTYFIGLGIPEKHRRCSQEPSHPQRMFCTHMTFRLSFMS